jgi:hypothetical protein
MGRPARSSVRSRNLVRHRWWRTLAFGALVNTIGLATGPAVGIVLLFITSASLEAIWWDRWSTPWSCPSW